MKLFANQRCLNGFTLPEVMIASSLFTLVLAGVISCHLFGIKMFEMTKAKLGANDDARRAITKMIAEIRSAKLIRIGTGDQNSFQEVADGMPQQGTAIQVFGTTNLNTYVRYFWDSNDKRLKRLANGSSVSIVAMSITNNLIFTSEDFSGSILTNNQNNRVLGLNLQFYQLQYPVVPVGPGHYYDYYQLRTRMTRRTLE